MARLDTVRQYFIERFVTAIGKAVAAHPGLSQPAELFTGGGFNVTPDSTGFIRIPTLQSLSQRIAAAADPKVRADIETVLGFVNDASQELTFGLGPVSAANLLQLATEYAPQLRQDNAMTFWPRAVADYLNYNDGTLRGYYYDASGRTPLQGQVFGAMFQNPSISSIGSFPAAPYEQRVPFVATIGVEPSVPPYPVSPLNVGQLNLTAADARFYPGAIKPTHYAEFKAIRGALSVNHSYLAAAATGRFGDLRNNRLHLDPDPTGVAATPATQNQARPAAAIAVDPVLLVYHAFYPIDDEARKTQTIDATNREGHHLAAGILLQCGLSGDAAPRPSHVFYCAGPDDIRVVPFDHPGLQFLDGSRHLVVYAGWGMPLRIQLDFFFSHSLGTIGGKNVSTAHAIGAGPYVGIMVAAYCAAVATGTIVGLPVAVVCFVVGVVLAVLLLLLVLACIFFLSCGEAAPTLPPPPRYTPQPPDMQPQYQDPGSYLTPTGSGVAGQTFDLQLIPHAIDQNLYGLINGAGATFAIQDDPGLQEMPGWAAFPGGFGYQVDRPTPGANDRPGSQWRDYYSLFVAKLEELQQAQSLVTYFGP